MLDTTDLAILELLQQNARTSNAEIARQVGLAPSAIFQRIKKLEESGIILGYTVRVDDARLGFGLAAFVMVRTAEGAKAPQTVAMLAEIPEVLEIHRVVGEDCFFLKVRVADTDALGDLLDHQIQPLSAVASTRTTIVLKTHKETRTIPLAASLTS